MTIKTTGEDDALIDQEEELDTDDTPETPEEDEEVDEDDQEDSGSDDSEDDDDQEETPKKETKDWKQIAENYKKRAEKAERENKDKKGGSSKPNPNSNQSNRLSEKDMYVLLENKVPSADFEDVVEYARFKKVSVEEALKSPVVKVMLNEKSETRRTANATQTGSQRRQSGRVSDQSLVENARKGQLPDNDADIERLAKARIASKKKRLK